MLIYILNLFSDKITNEKTLNLVDGLCSFGYKVECNLIKNFSSEYIIKNLNKADFVVLVLSVQFKEVIDSASYEINKEVKYLLKDINKKQNKYHIVSFIDDLEHTVPISFKSYKVTILYHKNPAFYLITQMLFTQPEYCLINEKSANDMLIRLLMEYKNISNSADSDSSIHHKNDSKGIKNVNK